MPVNNSHPTVSDGLHTIKNWHEKNGLARAEIILNVDPTQYGHTSSLFVL